MTVDQPVLVAVGVFLAYMLLVGVMWRVTGTRYDALVDSREHVVRGIIVSIGVGALLLAVATTWLGWWHLALFEDGGSGPAWALVVPVLMALAALINVGSIDFRAPQARLLPLILRGHADRGIRRGTRHPWRARRGPAGRRGERGLGLAGQLDPVRDAARDERALRAAGPHDRHADRVRVPGRNRLLRHAHDDRARSSSRWPCTRSGTSGRLGLLATKGQQKPVVGILAIATFLVAIVAVWFVIGA